MSTLDKIIYIADYIEPGRRQASGLPEVRQLAFISLDDCLFRILKDTLDYLHASKMEIDMSTQQTYDYYKALQCEQKRWRNPMTDNRSKEMTRLANFRS